ncbi:MAG: site-2 protease family protein [Proteobacteria bacterium]|nr:site-2 protease family protein [Pseudomonadota bacterium]
MTESTQHMRPLERPKLLLPVILFLITLLTTTTSGALYEGENPFKYPMTLISGLPFSASLLLILGTHELGHYFASVRHRVRATLPYFIPGPPLFMMIGTFGAVIRIKSPIETKRALVDIGAAGPLAGFAVAIIVVFIGLNLSWIIPVPESSMHIELGSSLIFRFIEFLVFGAISEGHDIFLHPVAFAGWIGLLVTCLNLLPIGQLDGGHILFAIFSKQHRTVSIMMICALLAFGAIGWKGWLVWGVLVTIIGIWHPPTLDYHEPLDTRRKAVGALTLIVFLLTFTPTPFYIN